MPNVRILTLRDTKGPAWARAHPERADDLIVVVAVGKRREKIAIGPPTPENRAEAERVKDENEAAFRAVSRGGLKPPTLARAAEDYLAAGMELHGLADTTQEDRRFILAENGPVLSELGEIRIDHLTSDRLLEWWERFVIAGSRSRKTGRNYLDALSGVYTYATERGFRGISPVYDVRGILRRANRTKSGRAQGRPEPTPIASPEAARAPSRGGVRLAGSDAREHATNRAWSHCSSYVLDTDVCRPQ